MTTRAVLRRFKPNRTQEVISINLQGIMDSTDVDVPLQNEDVLFIPTIPEHMNRRVVTILGEVVFPGTYEYADSMTLENFIRTAEGFSCDMPAGPGKHHFEAVCTDSGIHVNGTVIMEGNPVGTYEADMEQTVQHAQTLSRATRGDFAIHSRHETASGETTITVARSTNLLILAAIAAGILLFLLFKG